MAAVPGIEFLPVILMHLTALISTPNYSSPTLRREAMNIDVT
jgi:hypothetical protein